MPAISKIRLTNVVYEEGNKRYNDELFMFDGHNGAILLENGGGKTVLIQTALQAILPHSDLADRKIKNTLLLENAPAHIAIEWITNDKPRRYVVTAVTLFMTKLGLDSFRYVYEYDPNDPNGIEGIPFVRDGKEGKRTAEKGEMQDYYSGMRDRSFLARTFPTIKEYKAHIEEQYHLITSEWESIVKINSTEGGVEAFFDDCKSTNQLFDRLLIPTVERSIIGHDENMFADLFEKQHTSFKNYKKLKETLEENKRIQTQLENYVSTYERLHHKEEGYVRSKQRAKGAWIETLNQKQSFMLEQAEVHTKLEDWKENRTFHEMKSASYAILVEKTKLNQYERELKVELEDKREKEDALWKHQKDYYSLKHAERKLELKEQEDRLKHIEEELSKLEQTEELTDYEDELEEEKRALLGFFKQEEEKFETQKRDLSFELNPIVKEIGQSTRSKDELEQKERKLQGVISEVKGRIEARTKDLNRLKQQLLANPSQENVKVEMEKWTNRHQFLDQEIIRLQKEEKQRINEVEEADKKRAEAQTEQVRIEKEQSHLAYQVETIANEQTKLIHTLSALRGQWAAVDNIYLKQESISARVIEEIEKRRKERNSLLYQERIAYRFVDDHVGQETFFGDAFLEEQVKSWKNQVDYLVTGVEYLQTMSTNNEIEKQKDYSLWPLLLVTTNKSKDQVIKKVSHVADRLQYPIAVITTEEAISLHEDQHHQWIAPSHWNETIEPTSFNFWKDEISGRANEITQLRDNKEHELKEWEQCLKDLTSFLTNYPFEKVSTLMEEQSKLTSQIRDLSTMIQTEKSFIDEQQTKVSVIRTIVRNHIDEKQGLESKIEKAMLYLQYEREIENEGNKERNAIEELQGVLDHSSKLKRQISEFQNIKKDLEERLNALELELQFIKRDEEYKKIQTLTPVYSNKSKKVIQEKIKDLQFSIEKIYRNKGDWIERKKSTNEFIQNLITQINDLLNEHSHIDEKVEFPGDGEQLLQTLFNKISTLKQEVEIVSEKVHRKTSQKDMQKGVWKNKVEQFNKEFKEFDLVEFTQPIEVIAEELNTEKASLEARKSYVDQELTRIDQQIKGIEDAKHGLEMFVEGHHFNSPDIAASQLRTEEMTEFTYNRQRFVQSVTDELKKTKEAVESEKRAVEQAKRRFREFCNKEISDIKLQQMAMNGVEMKQSYDDITDFQKNMLNRIERISSYANEHIRQSDEDLQLFINQIHTHLLNLVEELKQIPKNTRVKVLDDWKQVFQFIIPEWEEEVGKMRIRDYIEWILQQLESERFRNDKGLEDEGKIRKDIEMWLQSKQLLQMVMNNEVLKVSCRKVTNDNKVTTRSYSWEQSNVWSGGEKWSKNMTLFLGILNYVAEKKQHIQSSMKRHRSVILDNPFGKASSDHVLSPVFFVAEQLGFQIIALTAHAEGKFLQDYFPVIYSCRLRASTDSNKKVMTKEKWLHHAYFQDHEPKTIERLGEMEQLVLFD